MACVLQRSTWRRWWACWVRLRGTRGWSSSGSPGIRSASWPASLSRPFSRKLLMIERYSAAFVIRLFLTSLFAYLVWVFTCSSWDEFRSGLMVYLLEMPNIFCLRRTPILNSAKPGGVPAFSPTWVRWGIKPVLRNRDDRKHVRIRIRNTGFEGKKLFFSLSFRWNSLIIYFKI